MTGNEELREVAKAYVTAYSAIDKKILEQWDLLAWCQNQDDFPVYGLTHSQIIANLASSRDTLADALVDRILLEETDESE